MRTRLSLFCDKVIEAGWLAAVIVVPLFFNIYSQRVFEPDKLSLLRSIALVMSAAWLVRVVRVAKSMILTWPLLWRLASILERRTGCISAMLLPQVMKTSV